MVIDLFGMEAEEVRKRFPAVYQHVLERVKPERDQNSRTTYREKWWIHGEPRRAFRPALTGLARYIATVETAKHRTFQFLGVEVAPDNMLVCIASEDASHLGILSSEAHVAWALAAGGRLGVGNDPRYNKTRCFEPFPFPIPTTQQRKGIGDLAEQLDAHRKRQQAFNASLTITGMYNVLEKLRSGISLTPAERTIHEQGLVSVLRQLHDDLDAEVLAAYGWSDLLPLLRLAHGNEPQAHGQSREDAARAFEEAVLERLVALNAERAAEEARGLIRWLRPEFQAGNTEHAPHQAKIEADAETAEAAEEISATTKLKPKPWPKDPIDQVRAVADTLAASAGWLKVDDITARFTSRGPWKRRVEPLLDMLVTLGRASERDGRYRARN
jgi:hypothetical protein